MQDAGQRESTYVFYLQPQRTRGEANLLGDVDQMIELGAFKGKWKTMTQLGQAKAQAMVASHNSQRSKTALSGF
jgi:hypothetical protein